MTRRMHLWIHGRVQGVSYRAYARDQARALGLTGRVRNVSDGSVELVAEGDEPALEALWIRCQEGPPWAEVSRVDRTFEPPTGEHTGFQITR
jgi:acylphosphatase